MQIVELFTKELIPYSNNPRNNDSAVDAVAASIKEFGFKVPIIVDADNVIVAGHTRLKAALQLGLEKVPCIKADDLSPEQLKAFRLADNKVGELATWDFDKLEQELDELESLDLDFEMSDFGFEIGGGTEDPEIIEDDFDEELPEEPKAKLGDVYELGGHRLICGDCTDVNVIDKLMDGQKADMIFTDPPYEIKATGGRILKDANSMNQIIENGVDSFDPSQLTMYCKTNVFCHNKPLIKNYIELAEDNEMAYDLAFYKKTNTAPNYKGHLMTDVEYIAIIGSQDPNKGLEKENYSKCYIGQKDSDNDLSYSKPIALCAKFIKLYSSESVLDPFGGSGSTLIACEELGRRCYMCELNPKYIDVIISRWEKFTGKKAKLIT